MNKLVILAFVSLSAMAKEYRLLPAPNQAIFSLPEAISLAKEKNSGLKKVKNQVTIAEGKVWQDMSAILPQLYLRASHRVNHDHGTDIFGEAVKAGLNLTAPLLNMRAFMVVKSSRESADAAKLSLAHETNQLVFNVANFYIEALIAQATKIIADGEQELYKKQLDLLAKKSHLGLARPLDISRSEYLYNKSLSEVILKERDYQRKLGELGASFARRESFSLSEIMLNAPSLRLPPDELLAMAKANADVASLKKDLAAQNYLFIGEGLDFLPKVSVSLESGYSAPYDKRILPSGLKPQSQLMLNLDLPIFTGLSTWGAMKSRQALKSSAELSLRQIDTDKHLSTYGVLDQIAAYQSMLQSSELALKAAQIASASAERLFTLGNATALELVEANTNLISAQNQLSSAQLRLVQNQIYLLFLIGKLDEIS